MRTRFFAAMVLVCMMLSQNAATQTMAVRGAGLESCGNWTAQRNGDRTLEKGTLMVAQGSWVLGFVSALQPLTSANVDNGGLWAWIDNYCAQHPLDTIATASFQLVQTLK